LEKGEKKAFLKGGNFPFGGFFFFFNGFNHGEGKRARKILKKKKFRGVGGEGEPAVFFL